MAKLVAKPSTMTIIRWAILLVIGITYAYKVANPLLGFIVFLLPVTFALLHSFAYFGKKHTLIMFGLIIAISYAAEYIGVHTGVLFGFYHYNTAGSINGFLVGGVPPLVTFSYVSMGYTCYVMARIILAQFGKLKGWALLGVPVIAAMFMTVWDMSFDPVASYVQQRYIWERGGAYFGVPFRNFTGWFITTVTFFIAISLYLNYGAKVKDILAKPGRLFLAEPVVLMALNALSIIAHETSSKPTILQQNMALVALFGLGTFVVITTFRLLDTRLVKT